MSMKWIVLLMKWTLKFDERVKKDFKKIGQFQSKLIMASLKEFSLNFCFEYENKLLKNQTIKKLKGDEYKDIYRIRIRSYRAFYKKIDNELIILIVRIDGRKDIYKFK